MSPMRRWRRNAQPDQGGKQWRHSTILSARGAWPWPFASRRHGVGWRASGRPRTLPEGANASAGSAGGEWGSWTSWRRPPREDRTRGVGPRVPARVQRSLCPGDVPRDTAYAAGYREREGTGGGDLSGCASHAGALLCCGHGLQLMPAEESFVCSTYNQWRAGAACAV